MSLDLSGALQSIAGDLPSSNAILTSIVTGALANTFITGVKNGGLGGVDPLGWFQPKQGSNNPPVPLPVTHPSTTMAIFSTFTPAQQAGFWAAGGVITG